MKYKHARMLIIRISALVLLGALSADILIATRTVLTYLPVSDNYLASVFSGTLTFSTLSLTVLSMIIGMMDTKMNGLKLREILALDSSPIKFTTYLVYSTSLSLLSLLALSFNLCTLMTAVTVCSLLYTTYASVAVYKLMSDVQVCLDMILEECQSRGDNFICNYVYRWLDEYRIALQTNSLSELNLYSKLLKKCASIQESSFLVSRHLPDLLDVASKNLPFAEAVSWVFDKTGFSKQAESICENYIRRIQFFSAEELLCFDIPEKINSLTNGGLTFHDSRDIDLSYFFFSALLSNEAAGSTKLEVLDSCISITTTFPPTQTTGTADRPLTDIESLQKYWNNVCQTKTSKIKKGIILKVFINEVLLSQNPLGDTLYEKLLGKLFLDSCLSRNNTRLETIACMYKYCYLLGVKSDYTDTESKKRIISLVTRITSIYSMSNVSLWNMVEHDIIDILSYYVKNAINPDYSSDLIFKDAISPLDSIYYVDNIRFAYQFYLASPIATISEDVARASAFPLAYKQFLNYRFPLLQFLDNMDANMQDVCTTLLKEFDPNTGAITEDCIKNVLDLKEMNGEHNISPQYINYFEKQTVEPVYQAVRDALKTASPERCK